MSSGIRQAGALSFSAGPAAYREVREHGLRPERIGMIAGASGGAKWLVLSQLDRVIARLVLPRLRGPVHTLGTSIGAWRLACYAQSDPLAAIERFEKAYLEQTFTEKPDRAEISRRTADILELVLGEKGIEEILSHPVLRTHIMAVRSRHLTASERNSTLAAGLVAAAGLNFVSRKALGLFFDRVLFFDPRCESREQPPFYNVQGFPLFQVPLHPDNLRDVVFATGAVPLIIDGVRDIAGAPPGMYRDGGVIDYHIDLPHSADDRLSLYPHFYGYIRPGWFDKRLSWRRPSAVNIDRMILVSPSPEFVAQLPGGKIPDRHDFVNYSTEKRIRTWRGVVTACELLADELEDALSNGRIAERIRPFA